ncbi:unnamed protein product [Brassica oleracea]
MNLKKQYHTNCCTEIDDNGSGNGELQYHFLIGIQKVFQADVPGWSGPTINIRSANGGTTSDIKE